MIHLVCFITEPNGFINSDNLFLSVCSFTLVCFITLLDVIHVQMDVHSFFLRVIETISHSFHLTSNILLIIMVAINHYFLSWVTSFFLLTTMIFLVLHGNHDFLLIVLPHNIQFSYLFHSFRQLDSMICLDASLVGCIGNCDGLLLSVCLIVLTYIALYSLSDSCHGFMNSISCCLWWAVRGIPSISCLAAILNICCCP